MNAPALEFRITLAAPPDTVFAALTDAHGLTRWFCDACESEPRVNGRLVMRWTRATSSREPFEARWVQFEPGQRAAYQGGHAGYPDGNAGTVWFELTAAAGGTQLVVTHTLPASTGYERMVDAWQQAWPRALDRLARAVTPPEPGA